METLPEPVKRLMEELSKLPSIGRKSAARLVYHLLRRSKEESEQLILALRDVRDKISECRTCFGYSEGGECPVCANEKRERTLLCVVEKPADVAMIERTGLFRGVYHVLGGAISPIDGITPDKLHIRELLARVTGPGFEVLLSTSTGTEGEQTASYLAKLLKERGARVTRVARGLPAGSDLQYMDEVTLTRAIEDRVEI